jgi:hypothetical protein
MIQAVTAAMLHNLSTVSILGYAAVRGKKTEEMEQKTAGKDIDLKLENTTKGE